MTTHSVPHGPAHAGGRWNRRPGQHGQHGQTMPLVLGIILILSLGTVMLVQNTFQQFPIVTKDLVQHQAYRAMVSGLDEYLYAVNANSNFAACNATFVNGAGSPVGTSALTSASSSCSALSFGTWTSVPGSGSANGPPAWFLIDNPKINTSTGNLSIDVVGAAGYPNTYNYQTAVVTLQPLNSFLLNVLWINFNQIDPPVVAQYGNNGTPKCTYYWNPAGGGVDKLGTNCANVDFVTADSLTGNLFVNDTIWLCGSPSVQNVQTADTQQKWVQDCSGSPKVSGTWTNGVPIQPIPSDNSTLETLAKANGCYYEGPTTIVLNGTTMNVTSYGTPKGKPSGAPGTSSSNDTLNDAANTANACMPASQGGSVSLPANGVVFVGGCTNQANGKCNGATGTTAQLNPLASAGETGTGGVMAGDAIVQGTITNPTTVGAANNIVIDGNLCYTDTMSAGKCTQTNPAAPSTNVLGLVALNYVEVNHPVDSGGNNVSSCSSSPGAGAVTCDLSDPIIDAVILALNHSFLVNNYNTGNKLGSINMYGTIDEDWRGPVGTSSGGTIVTGYAKNYQYDQRLVYLSPPYYLNPGTSQWGFAAFTVVSGACKTPSGKYPSACTGYP